MFCSGRPWDTGIYLNSVLTLKLSRSSTNAQAATCWRWNILIVSYSVAVIVNSVTIVIGQAGRQTDAAAARIIRIICETVTIIVQPVIAYRVCGIADILYLGLARHTGIHDNSVLTFS